MRCPNCGLTFKSAAIVPKDLQEYYSAVDFRKWESSDLFPTERRVVSLLRQLPAGSAILDVGCSSGRLLSQLTLEYRCFGVEINQVAAANAELKGIKLLDPNAWSIGDPGRQFDAIVLMDVFEHLTDPVSVLSDAAGRLSPRGKLIICTGNSDARALRDDLANCWYFRNVEHIVMLTRRFAEYLAERLLLRLVVWEPMCHYEGSPTEKLGQWYRSLAFDALHRGRRRWLAPLVRLLPGGKKARSWVERPYRNLTRDHVVVVLEKG